MSSLLILLALIAVLIFAVWFFLPASRPFLGWVAAGVVGFVSMGWEWLIKTFGG